MKKKSTFFLMIMCFYFLISCGAAFGMSYFGYEDLGKTWYDANKTWGDSYPYIYDSRLCWAGAASNALAYTGWGYPIGGNFNTAQDIFTYFTYNWQNIPGGASSAYNWWFTGPKPYSGSTGGGGFYPNQDYRDFYVATGGQTISVMQYMAQWLRDGYAVTADIRQNNGGLTLHAVSVWGYEYDTSGNYLGFYVADPDDRLNKLYYWSNLRLGTLWDGSTGLLFNRPGYNEDYYIQNLSGLMQMPTASVPVPPSIILLGSGLLIVCAKRFMKK